MPDVIKAVRLNLALVVISVLALTSCAAPKSAAPVGGILNILDPSPDLAGALGSGDVPNDWVMSGDPGKESIIVRTIDNTPALYTATSRTPFALMRRTKASLLATPFLTWQWNVVPPGIGDHPIEIVVGMINRTVKSDTPWWHVGSSSSDEINRVIAITFSETALDRGSVIGPIKKDGYPENARYVARGGLEQGRQWLTDTVDLSLIHRQVWPDDDARKLDIMMVGVRSNAATPGPNMSLSSVRLHR